MNLLSKLNFIKHSMKNVSPTNLIFITGCDSGLGFNLSLFCYKLNMTVISGCMDINSEGAQILQNLTPTNNESRKRLIPIELNLLEPETVHNALDLVKQLVSHEDYLLTALVNNAGIMCFGEFEWQTNRLFELQIQTNLLGTMKLTKEFLPLIRSQKSRIINVTSHCALHSLPGLGPYAASKAGLKFWNDSLRMEMKKYDVDVINFIPGSFVTTSNIAGNQQKYADEMRSQFSTEQSQFYGEYFENYNNYLKFISEPKKLIEMNDKKLFDKFKLALLAESPKQCYKHEPWRYTIYHWLFKYFPNDWLTKKFVAMPEYQPKN